MEKLRLKKQVDFKVANKYSICLRGARRFKVYYDNDNPDIYIYTPNNQNPILANIVSQNHYIFRDLLPSDFNNNYDADAQSYNGLFKAMRNCYNSFEEREIVTVLLFEIL